MWHRFEVFRSSSKPGGPWHVSGAGQELLCKQLIPQQKEVLANRLSGGPSLSKFLLVRSRLNHPVMLSIGSSETLGERLAINPSARVASSSGALQAPPLRRHSTITSRSAGVAAAIKHWPSVRPRATFNGAPPRSEIHPPASSTIRAAAR